jgi:hypothetical protein
VIVDVDDAARLTRHRTTATTGATTDSHTNGATISSPSVGSAAYRSTGQLTGSQAGVDARTASHGADRYGNAQPRRGGANA